MTHDERVYHHMYETNEGIAEHAERIASLEELVSEMLPWNYGNCSSECPYFEHCNPNTCSLYDEFMVRAKELGIEVTS